MIGSNLFVGVGGSGAATLSFLVNELKLRLIERDWPWAERAETGNPLPACWQFVAIDVDANDQPVQIPDTPPGVITRVSLAAAPDTMASMYGEIRNGGIEQETLGWLPPLPTLKPFNPYDGAGQLRAIGRAVLLARSDRAYTAIDKAAKRAASTTAQSDLALLASRCGYKTSIEPQNRRSFLVSSLSGGSGSGMWLDVAQWMNSRPLTRGEAWVSQRQYAFIYTPEVHQLINGPSLGMAPNSLMSLSEMISVYADRAPYDRTVEQWRARSGINDTAMQDKAPRSVFFIGAMNPSGVSFNRVEDVYSVTSQTIAAITAGEGHSNALNSVEVNVNTVNTIPLLRASHVLSSNIGYARLDLGRRTFATYASRLLFRRAVDRLLDGHQEFKADTYEKADQIIQRLADTEESMFFEATGLHEDDNDVRKNDQILEGVLPTVTIEGFIETFDGSFTKKVDDLVMRARRPDRLATAKRELLNVLNPLRHSARQAAMEHALAYSEVVRKQVLSAVVDVCSEYSAPVALVLLERLDAQLGRALLELQSEIAATTSRSESELDKLAAKIRDQANIKSHGKVNATQELKLIRFRAAVGFINETRTCLVQPLRRAFDAWITSTREQRLSDAFRGTLVDWDALGVPSELWPSSTIVMLEQPDTFPSQLTSLLRELFGDRDGPEDEKQALDNAVREIVFRSWPQVPIEDNDRSTYEVTGQLLIREPAPFRLSKLGQRIEQINGADQGKSKRKAADVPDGSTPGERWIELFEDFCGGRCNSPQAQFAVADLLSLSEVANRWVHHRQGVLTDFVSEGFGAWLSTAHTNHRSRQEHFMAQFEIAVSRAAPLAQISAPTLAAVHGQNSVRETVVIEPPVPIAANTSLATKINHAIDGAQLGSKIEFVSGGTDTSRLEIFRSFTDGLHPLAFDSMISPIRNAFGVANDQTFWLLRRARPLARAIGLTPAQVVGFARGWMTLLALGRIDTTKGRVWLDNGWVAVPQERLKQGARLDSFSSSASRTHDAWALVALESLPMRLVKYPNEPTSLDFYVKVLHAGGYTDSTGTTQENDVNARGVELCASIPVSAPDLEDWISGNIPTDRRAPKAPHQWAGSPSGTEHERRATLHSFFDHATVHYLNLEDDRTITPPSLGDSAGFESQMLLYLLVATEQLRNALVDPDDVPTHPHSTNDRAAFGVEVTPTTMAVPHPVDTSDTGTSVSAEF